MVKRCPICGEEININAVKCKYCGEFVNQQSTNSVQTRKCPYCGEEIMEGAKKCKHCKEFLQPTARNVQLNQSSHNYKNEQIKKEITRGYDVAGLIFNSFTLLCAICVLADSFSKADLHDMGFTFIWLTCLPLILAIIGVQNKNKGISITSIIISILNILISINWINLK